jgi:hypothetical protein
MGIATRALVLGPTIVMMFFSVPSGAGTVKCQRAIARQGAKFVQSETKALRRCQESVVHGKGSGPCPDGRATAKISTAATKVSLGIAKACGGDDRQCGGDPTNEDTPASLGWPSACPGFENNTCAGSMNDCGGISQCLLCVGEAAVDQAIDLYYGDLSLPSTTNPALNKCQVTLGKASAKYLATRAKILQHCWDARLKGMHMMVCPDPNDTKIQLALSNAHVKAQDAICKACGGPEKTCNGSGDVTRPEIGFAFDCPSVQPVGANACTIWNPSNSLFDLVQCALCVATFKTDCTDRAAVPQFVSYPVNCGGGPQPTPTPAPCHNTGGTSCSGDCPSAQICVLIQDGVCGCVPDGTQPCGDSAYPSYCNGTCTGGDTCGTSKPTGGVCLCGNPPCGQAPYPTCGGDCPGTDICLPTRVNGVESCWCSPVGISCGTSCPPSFGTCGPGLVCEFPACACTPE